MSRDIARQRVEEPAPWQAEFPYRQDREDTVTRREFLRFTVLASGGLFAGTVVLAVLGAIRGKTRGSPKALARVADIPPGEALYVNYPGHDDQAVIINTSQGFVAYTQKCTHLSCAVYYQKNRNRLFCPCHDGAFAIESGEPIQGPPQRRLPRIRTEVRGDELWALEEVP